MLNIGQFGCLCVVKVSLNLIMNGKKVIGKYQGFNVGTKVLCQRLAVEATQSPSSYQQRKDRVSELKDSKKQPNFILLLKRS